MLWSGRTYAVVTDLDMLDRLEAVYIEARYPGEMGLLPGGKPSMEEAASFWLVRSLSACAANWRKHPPREVLPLLSCFKRRLHRLYDLFLFRWGEFVGNPTKD